MYVTELDTFVHKFHQLWNAGYNEHLDLDSYAGNAWVGLRVQLGHVPGPLHHQVPPHFFNHQKKRESSSSQHRRARRTAEGQEAASTATRTEAAKADEQQVEISDFIQTTEK